MYFNEVWDIVGKLPYTNRERCEWLYNFVINNSLEKILELGFAYGKTTCVMAKALDDFAERGDKYGFIDTIDLESQREWQKPSIEDNLWKSRLDDHVQVYREKTGYLWWLAKKIQEQSVGYSICKPLYDFVFVDGSHRWHTDSSAFFLADKLLKRGGYMLFDDYLWTFDGAMGGDITFETDRREMSDEERKTPHIKLIVDLLVRQHPGYVVEDVMIGDKKDEWWVLARKL